jgi:hypothetical protein
MKFVFRWHMQLNAEPRRKLGGGFREGSSHAEAIADAAERFVRERLTRKRVRTLTA